VVNVLFDFASERLGGAERSGVGLDNNDAGQFALNGGECLRVAPRDNDLCAFSTQEFGGGQANAGRAAGDEDGLILKIKLMPSFAGKSGLGIHSVRLSCFPSRVTGWRRRR
jgi:hypothetical protein